MRFTNIPTGQAPKMPDRTNQPLILQKNEVFVIGLLPYDTCHLTGSAC